MLETVVKLSNQEFDAVGQLEKIVNRRSTMMKKMNESVLDLMIELEALRGGGN